MLVLALATLLSAHAAESWSLRPIVVEGLPSEALEEDLIVPAAESRTSQSQGTGSVQRTLENQLPFSFRDPGRPGEFATIRGLGLSGEENSTEAFGVPLSPPQGGGFNLGTFPQFLWSGSRFRLGPSLAGIDPRGVSGTLTLVPWTQEALAKRSGVHGKKVGTTLARLTQNYSSLEQGQTSIGGVYGDVAAVAGYSYGEAEGPAGSLSTRWKLNERVSGKIHLLGAHLDAPADGAPEALSPDARLITTRVIPVAQADVSLDADTLWKSSAYFDFGRLQYEDPANPTFGSDDRVRQWGAQTAYVTGATRVGANFRQAFLKQLASDEHTEASGAFQLSHAFEEGAWLFEPTFQALGFSGYGVLPAGSIGARWSPSTLGSAYIRVSYTRRFASLLDRFYEFPGYQPNPNLRPEKNLMVLAGTERSLGSFKNSFEGYAQLRQDAQIRPFTGPFNEGQGRIAALIHRLEFQAGGGISLRHAATAAGSRLDSTGRAFPYIPKFVEVLGIAWQSSPENPGVTVSSSLRGATRAQGGGASDVPGYGWVDLGGAVAITRMLRAELTIENLADRRIRLTDGVSPTPGRVFSVALVGEID